MEDYDSDLELTIVGEPSTSLAQQRHQDLSRELADIDRQLAALQRRRAAVVQRMENAQAEIDNSARLEQKKRNEKLKDTYDSIGFRWSTQACSLLKSVFKLQGFRDNQEAIINATLDGRDVVVIMPTGGGKSL
ncbi:ATP-dependent DNA helicase sgs1, partial [Coemansia sp. RSA 2708]